MFIKSGTAFKKNVIIKVNEKSPTTNVSVRTYSVPSITEVLIPSFNPFPGLLGGPTPKAEKAQNL